MGRKRFIFLICFCYIRIVCVLLLFLCRLSRVCTHVFFELKFNFIIFILLKMFFFVVEKKNETEKNLMSFNEVDIDRHAGLVVYN